MTGRDLITASMRLIGAVASGETIAASEASDGLSSLNRLIDSWANESLVIYNDVTEEFNLTPSQQSYTIGSGGNFNTVRPMKYLDAKFKVTSTTPNAEYPLNELTLSEWASVRQKTLSTNISTDIYFDVNYPLDTIYLYPVPSAAAKLVLYTRKQLSNISTLDTNISLPPGYERALVYNFAVEISPEYGKPPSELVMMIANESKAALKRNNHKEMHLRVDEALVEPQRFNIYTGDYR